MRRSPLPLVGLRNNPRGAAETMQVVPAFTVVVVCVALVLAAVHGASLSAHERAAHQRASLQAEILLDALRDDPALAECCGLVSLAMAKEVSTGARNLSFLPSAARVVSLSWLPNGTEIFLHGNASALEYRLVIRAQPVPVLHGDNTVHPGILRVGVEVR